MASSQFYQSDAGDIYRFSSKHFIGPQPSGPAKAKLDAARVRHIVIEQQVIDDSGVYDTPKGRFRIYVCQPDTFAALNIGSVFDPVAAGVSGPAFGAPLNGYQYVIAQKVPERIQNSVVRGG